MYFKNYPDDQTFPFFVFADKPVLYKSVGGYQNLLALCRAPLHSGIECSEERGQKGCIIY